MSDTVLADLSGVQINGSSSGYRAECKAIPHINGGGNTLRDAIVELETNVTRLCNKYKDDCYPLHEVQSFVQDWLKVN